MQYEIRIQQIFVEKSIKRHYKNVMYHLGKLWFQSSQCEENQTMSHVILAASKMNKVNWLQSERRFSTCCFLRNTALKATVVTASLFN